MGQGAAAGNVVVAAGCPQVTSRGCMAPEEPLNAWCSCPTAPRPCVQRRRGRDAAPASRAGPSSSTHHMTSSGGQPLLRDHGKALQRAKGTAGSGHAWVTAAPRSPLPATGYKMPAGSNPSLAKASSARRHLEARDHALECVLQRSAGPLDRWTAGLLGRTLESVGPLLELRQLDGRAWRRRRPAPQAASGEERLT